jgi:hypothetical protein
LNARFICELLSRTGLIAFAIGALVCYDAPRAFAQDTRADVLAQQQTEKAANLRAEEPTRGERIFLAVKKEFIDTPSGPYPLFGSVYGGGGFALGAGYRHYYGDRAFWNARGLWSIRNYKLAELSTTSPGHAGGRVDLSAQTGWIDATQVAYYGAGPRSSADDRANFRFQEFHAGAAVKARPAPIVVLAGGVSYEDYRLMKGLGRKDSVEERFNPVTAPGLGASPSYLHSSASAGIDWRPAAGYSRRGGLYEMRYHNYRDGEHVHSFDRVEAEAVQHIPILRENWVVSMRGLVNSTLSGATPYFLLPSLGSGSTMRGYSTWRFRDRHSLLLQGEFRWIPNRTGLDMALFYDAGKVTGLRSDLDFRGLRKDVGIEVRFHGPSVTPLRFGMARGDEGWQFVFGGAAAF